ncbi:hypothetical protein M8C21_031827, partial [Ambrosia artemisiifolia]
FQDFTSVRHQQGKEAFGVLWPHKEAFGCEDSRPWMVAVLFRCDVLTYAVVETTSHFSFVLESLNFTATYGGFRLITTTGLPSSATLESLRQQATSRRLLIDMII